MKRSETTLSAQARGMSRHLCLCGTIFPLLLGMSPGMPQAQGKREGALDRAIRATPRHPGPAGRFHFDDLRIQASQAAGAPALARARSGQKFCIASYFQHWQSPNTNIAVIYTVTGPAGLMHRETSKVRVVLPQSKLSEQLSRISITLPAGVQERKFVIRAVATMNGVTQTRTTRFTVYR